MDKIVNFPGNDEITMGDDISRQNIDYHNSIIARVKEEYKALIRTGNEQVIATGALIDNIVCDIIDRVFQEFDKNPELSTRVHVAEFMHQCMQSINAIFAGGVISPLTGVDEEWEDVTVDEDIGQQLKFKYRGNEYAITIESVQVNRRYPKIYRLNNDNRYAHRLDFFQFHDVRKPENIHLTEDSIRFIQFPYLMQSVHSKCVVDEENRITDFLDFDYDDIANGLIYPDFTNDDPHSYIIAPKIPFHMLEEKGISAEDEISAYLNMIDHDSDDEDYYDDEDDDVMDGFGDSHYPDEDL